MILGEGSTCRGNPPAPCDAAQNVLTVLAPQHRHPQTPRAAEPWAELWLPPFSCREQPLQEQRPSREKGSQKKGKMGWQSRCERTVSETKAKARKQSLALLFSLKKKNKNKRKVELPFSFLQHRPNIRRKTQLFWDDANFLGEQNMKGRSTLNVSSLQKLWFLPCIMNPL